jgi:hypothetical protein
LISFPSLFHNILNIWIAPSLNCKFPSMCVHTSHWPYGYPYLMLCSWQRTYMNPWCNSWHLCCHYVGCWFPCRVRTTTCASFKHIQLLLSMNWHYVQQRWHSHCSQQCHCQPNMSGFTSSILRHPRICYFWCGSSQRTKLSWLTPHWSIPPHNSGGIWMFT